MTTPPEKLNRYKQIIEQIFLSKYTPTTERVPFRRDEFETIAASLQIKLPKNLGDILYSFKYRVAMPASIIETAPEGKTWILRSEGRSLYAFVLVMDRPIVPTSMLAETKIPDATPGIVVMYALGDEQALLTRLRYNRLIDIFTGVTCYSLQNHLRTTVAGMGQIETDEVYVGIDRAGAHYVFPIQAKGGNDKLNIVQIEQDIAMCREKYPNLACRPIGAQFMHSNLIALFEFEQNNEGVFIANERHYRLVPPDHMTANDLLLYRTRSTSER